MNPSLAELERIKQLMIDLDAAAFVLAGLEVVDAFWEIGKYDMTRLLDKIKSETGFVKFQTHEFRGYSFTSISSDYLPNSFENWHWTIPELNLFFPAGTLFVTSIDTNNMAEGLRPNLAEILVGGLCYVDKLPDIQSDMSPNLQTKIRFFGKQNPHFLDDLN